MKIIFRKYDTKDEKVGVGKHLILFSKKLSYAHSNNVYIVLGGVVLQWLPCLIKKTNVNGYSMPKVKKYVFMDD